MGKLGTDLDLPKRPIFRPITICLVRVVPQFFVGQYYGTVFFGSCVFAILISFFKILKTKLAKLASFCLPLAPCRLNDPLDEMLLLTNGCAGCSCELFVMAVSRDDNSA